MSKVNCDGDKKLDVPCGCDCGHLAVQHVVYTRWLARCTIAGCICTWLDVCGCVQEFAGEVETDRAILAGLGIAVRAIE